MNGAGSFVLLLQKTSGVDEERAFKQSLKLLDSRTSFVSPRDHQTAFLHVCVCCWWVIELHCCHSVSHQRLIIPAAAREEATSAAMFKCGHYNDRVPYAGEPLLTLS